MCNIFVTCFDNFFFHFYFLFPHARPNAAHIRPCTLFTATYLLRNTAPCFAFPTMQRYAYKNL